MRSAVLHLSVLGVRVAAIRAAEALAEIERIVVERRPPGLVFFANAHALNLAQVDPEFKRVLGAADLVLPDGSGVAIAARLQGSRVPENLNGSDFTPKILGRAAARGWGVYFLGARPGVAERAARALSSRIPGLRVAGTSDGFFPRKDSGLVVDSIRRSAPDVILVAMGNPLQEKWLAEHLHATGARLGVGVGAFFDFAAGSVSRAPAWMNRLGIEWTYRLALEPRRMWRRYVIGNPLFVTRVVRERVRRAGS